MATRWGICAAGKISNDFMVALQTLPAQDHQAVAIAAKDQKRAKEFAKTHSIPKVYGSYEELAKDPNIDIVYVGVLHIIHRDIVLMYLEHRKNVICEKPLAMNSKEVKELIAAARKYNVFFMEAMWSRYFPVYDQIRSLLSQKAIGDVKIVRAEFGSNQYHVPRAVGKELGGGALLDIGCYCLQFALMVFKGEKPESVTAKGFLYDTGVDETVTIILQYSGKRQAILTCTIMVAMPNQAAICGSTGMIQIPSCMWCPTSVIVNGKETQFPLPQSSKPMHFTNSTGLGYEAEHVRQCLLKGLKESPLMTLADSELLHTIMDEVRKQLGVCFPQDKTMATKWGICSAGKISNDFVVALQILPAEEHQVVAVAARDFNRAKEFAQCHGIAKVYATYEELANDPGIDIIYIGAIHPVHRNLGLMCIEKGKNVLCEKPLAMNLTEVNELISAARKHNVFLMEAFWSRFFPVYDHIRSVLKQKILGEVRVVRAEFGVSLLHVPRAVEKELGGGALLDIGCYCLQFALLAFDGEKPESITAKGFLHETGVDETVTIILQYSRKRQAILTCTFMTEMPNQAVICGTDGIIQIPSFMWSPTTIIVNGEEKTYSLPSTTKHVNFWNSTGLSYEAEHVRECLLKGLKESPVMNLAESELLASIMEEVHIQLGIFKNKNTDASLEHAIV
ncbi:uncharacterized protein ACMZJ9_018960 [Mantella aurantiaca]